MGRGKKHKIHTHTMLFLKLSLYSFSLSLARALFLCSFFHQFNRVCVCVASLYVRLIVCALLFYSIRFFRSACLHWRRCCSRIHSIATVRNVYSIVVAMMLLLLLPLCFVFYSVSILWLIHFVVFCCFFSSLIRQCAHTHHTHTHSGQWKANGR